MARSQIFGVSDFTRALNMIAQDNNMQLRNIEYWPEFLDYTSINAGLNQLNHALLEEFVIGETTQQQEIAETFRLEETSVLLNSIFDGDLSYYFFE